MHARRNYLDCPHWGQANVGVHAPGEIVSLVALVELEAAIEQAMSVVAFDSDRQAPSFSIGNRDIGID